MPAPLTEQFVFLLTEEDKGLLMLMADEHDLSMGAMLRKLIRDNKHLADSTFDDI